MQIVIVGAGPTGLYLATTLARRGHRVAVIDRDPGPPRSGPWRRRGVMQFEHAHTFRGPVVDLLRKDMPELLDRLLATGASIPVTPDSRPAALLCRRSTFETTMRAVAAGRPGVDVVTGHVDRTVHDGARVRGVYVDRRRVTADLVLDASGRASRFSAEIRPRAIGEPCGVAYVTRQYRLRPGTDDPPTNSPIGLSLSFARYFAVAFLHDAGTFSITIAHDGRDPRVRDLRHAHVFDSVVRRIPRLRQWIDVAVSEPTTPVLPGGRLHNGYRGQCDQRGALATPGMISVGDAVCTTTPLAGRGVTLALAQASRLTAIIDDHGADVDSAAREFDAWCASAIRPWFDDHRHADADRLRRWAGGDVDLTRTLPSDLIVAAGAVDDRVRRGAEPYARMDALPDTLAAVEPLARGVYASGWRPAAAEGPVDLGEVCDASAAA
ncbi:FAD-dependent oxidoreductase [Mycolicibacterium lacusdiani]|uniref:FAD-dependent oxidoreductase n=1 Tax=Mycolicibacterium lacusdiani TaxID=2895283 RepID=UPI001F1DBCF4|nr:FAD-dependent oxidoreductase [Mycolicibacterium lacusdiani]